MRPTANNEIAKVGNGKLNIKFSENNEDNNYSKTNNDYYDILYKQNISRSFKRLNYCSLRCVYYK